MPEAHASRLRLPWWPSPQPARREAVARRIELARRRAVARARLRGARSSSGPPASRRGSSTCRSSTTPTSWRAPSASRCARVVAAAQRGDILDRHGHVLAYSVDADTIAAVPGEIDDPEPRPRSLCGALDDCDAEERADIAAQAEAEAARSPTWRGRCRPTRRSACATLSLPGIGFVKESRRFYPNNELAAHVLGYVGLDNIGLGGIESAYDSQIRGKDGKVLIQTDARRHAFSSRVERPADARRRPSS